MAADGYPVAIFASSFSHAHYIDAKLARGERWQAEVHDGVSCVWVRMFPYRHNDWRRYLNMLSYLVNAVLAGWLLTVVYRVEGMP